MAWSTPRTWVAGETVTASIMNGHVRDQFKAIGDSAATYTPTWSGSTTNPVLGNGSISGRYQAPGKWCRGTIQLTMGSTTTYGSGFWSFSLPASAVFGANGPLESTALAYDTSAIAGFRTFGGLLTAATMLVYTNTGTLTSPTVPFTWATTDILSIPFAYETA